MNNKHSTDSALLQSAWERYSHSVVSTPPPSPTNSNRETDVKNGGSLISQETEVIARLVLQCFTHFFSWIPIANYVTPYLLELIFHFVRIGAEESLPQLKSNAGTTINNKAFHYVSFPRTFNRAEHFSSSAWSHQ